MLRFLKYVLLCAGSIYPHTSGNYALGDLLTALKWVQLNIAHFGGNPESVTLLGHGQGAGLVTAITAVPAADGLYHRVWASNGAGRYTMNHTPSYLAANSNK
jgi:carboxylesterase type B